eukprot:749729-Hanusia_phi.AAC.5
MSAESRESELEREMLLGMLSLCPRYYTCTTYICGFAAMAYFAMLSGQGWTAVAGCRQFFYARLVSVLEGQG